MISVAKAAGKRLLGPVSRRFSIRRHSAEGVLDLQRRRYMLDHGGYARLGADGKERSGISGQPISTMSAEEPYSPSPLWLIDVLTGLAAATAAGTEVVRGTPCRHFHATVDLSRASKLTPGGVWVPARERFEDLLELPIEVWVDEQHVRRVRFTRDIGVDTIELWDVDLSPEALDWTRLPAFRSPQNTSSKPSASLQ